MQVVDTVANPSQPHVLVVDDDVDISALLCRYLGGHGCQVSTAASGA